LIFFLSSISLYFKEKMYSNLKGEMGAVSEDMKNGDPEQVHLYKRAKAPNNSLTKWCLNGTKFLSRAL
jgi:hypothetical protein